VPIRAARQILTRVGAWRAGQCIGLAALALLLGNRGLQNAVAEGDTRTISLHHIHTGEDITITFKREGRYDDEALKKLNHILRDWRRDEETKMDPRLLDVVWEVYRDVDAKGPIHVVCGYRSPATNAMLRRRSRGVAQFSQHMLGRAMDFFIPGVPLEKQREAGLRLQRGGVGYYPSSGSPFVHLDVGSIRMWPRMTHDQLARVFPDGRTVHVPSDGRPLRGYALALADVQKRGSSEPSPTSLDAARTAGLDVSAQRQRSLFSAMFTSKDEDEDSETGAAPNAKSAQAVEPKVDKTPDKIAEARPAAPKVAEIKVAETKAVPLPMARPTLQIAAKLAQQSAPAPAFNLASAESRPVDVTNARAPSSANDVISSRGFWQAPAAEAAPPQEPTRLASADTTALPAPRARDEQRPAATDTTGAVAPWPVKTADAAGSAPSQLALAYAAQANGTPAAPAAPATPATRGLTAVNAAPRNAATLQPTRVAAAANQTAPVRTATATALKPGTPLDDPWLRALVLAPDLQNYLTAMVLGQSDMRELQPLMVKPDAVVTMAFGDDPNLGLATDHFTGSAVVFVTTTTFDKRTAALQ
jgi:uncharacterized protein YcbK (DUF882 family)